MADLINKLLTKLHNFKGFDKKPKPEPDYTKPRQYVGEIIIAVLTERICVREALLRFPKSALKDPSVQAAWHALCHYESDEDIKSKDHEYIKEQVSLLEMIAFEFKDGHDLPVNIIEGYKEFYDEALIAPEKGVEGLAARILRFIHI